MSDKEILFLFLTGKRLSQLENAEHAAARHNPREDRRLF